FFFFSSRRRHTRSDRDWSSDVCSSDLGNPLALTPVEYEILLSLARSAGRVKSREQVLLEVADRDFEVFDRSIDVHVSSLRKKLGDRKSTRLNSSHDQISYAVFCLKKKS